MPITSCLLILFFCLIAVSPGYAEDAFDQASFRYLTEEYAPYNYTENGKPTGLAVSILKLIWQKMGIPEQPIKIVPWTRAYNLIKTDPNIVAFSAFRTAERETLFHWVGPIAEENVSIFALQENNLPIKHFSDFSQYRVGTIRNAPGLPLPQESDSNNVISAHAEGGIKMLNLGRIDFLAMDDHTFSIVIAQLGFPANHFKKVWTLKHVGLYYIFNKQVSDELIARFQKALDAVKESPVYRNLRNHYLN